VARLAAGRGRPTMSSLVRRVRGALAIGAVWGAVWIAIGLVVWAVIRMLAPEDIEPGEGLDTALPILGLAGFLAGLGFAGLLSIAERRAALDDLSLPRVALWGLLGSAAIPWLIGSDGSMGWVTGPLGAHPRDRLRRDRATRPSPAVREALARGLTAVETSGIITPVS
jgi:hypothetical protein